ncbi:MAG TPA: hypothetical protein PKB06_10205 [Actinotalea sp.]|nr:hypothetical protein [Actinotalea sp.]
MSVIRVPRKKIAERLGPHGEQWVKGAWSDSDGRVCLHGAIRECCPQPGDAFLIEQVADVKGWGTGWNDAKGTSWEDVADLLASPRMTVTDADLAEVFGPQWREFVALVRRAATLTHPEAERLADARSAAARAAARDAARAAAWAAARAAAWDAARAADQAAARDAARAAAWDAARDAAAALVVRDLIGRDGFTQEHYDLLTGPWRSVVGPVHPDDPDRREAP